MVIWREISDCSTPSINVQYWKNKDFLSLHKTKNHSSRRISKLLFAFPQTKDVRTVIQHLLTEEKKGDYHQTQLLDLSLAGKLKEPGYICSPPTSVWGERFVSEHQVPSAPVTGMFSSCRCSPLIRSLTLAAATPHTRTPPPSQTLWHKWEKPDKLSLSEYISDFCG